MRRALSLLFVLLAAICVACAGSGNARPKTIPQPGLDARLTAQPFFGSSATAPANVEVTITNHASVPITVNRIEVDSPGMVEFTLIPTAREFRDTIGPGETKSVTVFATARTMTSRPTESLTIRAIVELEAQGARWREFLIAR